MISSKFVGIIMLVPLLFVGCNDASKIDNNKETPNAPAIIEKVNISSEKLPEELKKYTEVSSYTGDIDGDEKDETIVLSTSAQKDQNGEFVWDDGQKWALYITENADDAYILYDDYVQLGNVEFDVSDYYMNDGTDTKVTVTISTGAGLKLINYSYDKETHGYAQEVVYDTDSITTGGINRRFSSSQ
ncbi:MAG: hypothetical protein PHE51_02460 [Eubacteriales bacterium]|nr:hypothetical protein [Eubacteriales bacterium]